MLSVAFVDKDSFADIRKMELVNRRMLVTDGAFDITVVVYPAIWAKPIEENTIFVSDVHLKYAKLYALKTILDSL